MGSNIQLKKPKIVFVCQNIKIIPIENLLNGKVNMKKVFSEID